MQIVVGIKYCGGCNPHIDRTGLVAEISKRLPSSNIVTTKKSLPWDIGILVCGCPNACADKPYFKNLARQWIIVAGNSVDLHGVPEEKLADIITDKIKNLR